MIKSFLLIFPILWTLSSCEKEPAKPPKAALEAVKKLGTELKAELRKGLQESPQEAVKICNVKAREIAREAATEGVDVGRVSLKNRNPDNYPKEWMMDYIQSFHKGEIKDEYVVVDLEDDKKGMLKPIIAQPLCLTCHGKNIPEGLNAEIKKLYPKDKATGYGAGDIRGFFWAEWEPEE